MRLRTRIVLAALLAAPGALAQGTDEARTFFEIGAKAFKAGNYQDAITAFEQAYGRAKRPGLMFSLGQAHRMQYFAKGNPEDLRAAVKYYREYLDKEPSGPRRGEVQEVLEKLVPQLDKLDASTPVAPSAPDRPKKPRVMVATQTPGARVVFDGKDAGEYFAAEVEPGKHTFRVSAPGYFEDQREIVVDASKELPPFSIDLKEKPAYIVVRAPEGAEIAVDGRVQGTAPMPPIEMKPGAHFVAITRNGYDAFTQEVELARGERRTLSATLHPTRQRSTSWVLMGIGAGGIVAGGVLGFVSLSKQSQARELRDRSEGSGNLTPSDRARYDSLRQSRDDFRLAALITGGAGLVVGATGFVLHQFDQPRVQVPELRERPKTAPGAPKEPGAPSMEVSALPMWVPGFAGGSVVGRF